METQMARDLELARATDMPVLISGTPAASRAIARELERQSRSAIAVEVVDCRKRGALGTLHGLTHPDPAAVAQGQAERRRILLLEEVHALDPADQALLEKEIEEVRTHPRPAVRIMASSSAPLFERVVDQLFSERLFYRLNVIHVVLPSGAGESSLRAE